MRLRSLELENFRQYARAQVPFETGITAIVGANGAGKSTLVEAILWALYGARVVREGAKTLRFLWSQGGARVRVKLEFELSGQPYRVERTPADALLFLLKEGDWTLLARGTAPVNEMVRRLLGMDERQFQTSFCARQKELEFMAYQPQRRREEISKMLGYERVSKAYELISNDTRQLTARVEGLKQGILEPEQFQKQITETIDTLAQLQSEKERTESELQSAQQNHESLRQECLQHEQKQREHEYLLKQKQLLEAQLRHIVQRLEEQRKQWDEVKQAKERFDAIKDQVQRYRDLGKQLRELDSLAQSEQERARLNAQIGTLHQQIEQLQQKLSLLQQKRTEYETLTPQLERAKQIENTLAEIRKIAQQAGQRAQLTERLETLRQRLAELDTLAQELETVHRHLAELQSEIEAHEQAIASQTQRLHNEQERWNQQRSEAQANFQSLQREYRQLKERYEQLEQLGAESICPTCGQPLGEGYHKVMDELRAEMQKVQAEGQKARKQVEALNQEPASLQQARTALERLQGAIQQQYTTQAQLQQQARQLKQQLNQREELEKQVAQLERTLQSLPEYDPEQERALQAEREGLEPIVQQARILEVELREEANLQRELATHQRTLNQLQAELNKLPIGYDPALHQQVRQEVDALTPLYEEYNQLVPILQRKESLREQINRTRAEQTECEGELQQTIAQIAELGFDETAYQQALLAYQSAEAHLNAVRLEYNRLLSEIDAKNQLLQTLQSQLDQIRARQQELAEAQKSLVLHQTTRQALQEFRAELNTRLQPLLSNYATEFLIALTNGRYSQLELNEDFEFYIVDEGVRKEVISGGEEDIVNLSMRLALARLITERAGQPLSLLILDEVFGSLDTDRRRSVMNLLNSLRDWFEQILVISHIEEINDSADRCLYVVRDERTRTSTVMERTPPSTGELLAETLLDELESEAV